MTAKPHILFVSHDASVTGAPNSLLNFLDWNVQQGKCSFRILLLDGGPLEEQFARRGRVVVVRQQDTGLRNLVDRIWKRLRAAMGGIRESNPRWTPSWAEQSRVNDCLAAFKPDLIYLNSVAAAPALACLKRLDVPVLTFLRELEEYVEKTRATGWLEPLIERTCAFISVSEASRKLLMEQSGLPLERCTIINTFIDTHELRRGSRAHSRAALLERAGLTEAEFIVAGCGTTDWRKGPDLFLTIARTYFESPGNDRTVFLWIGGLTSPQERLRVFHDIRMAGMEGRVLFIGQQDDAALLLAGADVLALTSREEPFARVMLEAALGYCPVVCFERSGGPEEFTRKGAGIAVPYMSVTGFASALAQLRHNETLRTTLGATAFKTVIRDHDIQGGSQRIYTVIETLLPPARTNSLPTANHRDALGSVRPSAGT